MPATYAVICEVLNELQARLPKVQIESALDIGAGPGTGLWALKEFFTPSLARVTLLEKDPGFVALGKELEKGRSPFEVRWETADVVVQDRLERHDLVLASCSLGEMEESDARVVVLKMWEATQKVLILIEPGTPKGFERMRSLRTLLIAQGAHLIAPCPHAHSCPMQGGDWCHFAARVERTSFHRQIKNGTMNYEDEKYSYLIFSREKIALNQSRILSRPQKQGGFVNLKLCSEQGIEKVTISRKFHETYRRARHAEWGDLF
jgi:ribosomal protein RSM22 (predicted rRNA methylase)